MTWICLKVILYLGFFGDPTLVFQEWICTIGLKRWEYSMDNLLFGKIKTLMNYIIPIIQN